MSKNDSENLRGAGVELTFCKGALGQASPLDEGLPMSFPTTIILPRRISSRRVDGRKDCLAGLEAGVFEVPTFSMVESTAL